MRLVELLNCLNNCFGTIGNADVEVVLNNKGKETNLMIEKIAHVCYKDGSLSCHIDLIISPFVNNDEIQV